MRTIQMLFVVLALLLPGVLPVAATESEQYTAYAYIAHLPEFLYLAPSYDARTLENELLYQNTGPSDILVTRYTVMVGDLYRFAIQGEWAQVLPDNGGLDPFTQELGVSTYLPIEYLDLLDASDFAPISGVSSSERLVVVIRDSSPRVVVFNGLEIVLHTPAFLGRGGPENSLTPYGDTRVYMTRASDNMPSFHGIPYVAYFTGDRAFHEYHGWNWAYLNHGGYGSLGCVNLPDRNWFTVSIGSEQISVAQWLYRWFSSVPSLDYDEMNPNEELALITTLDEGWYDTTASVRVMVVNSIWDLYEYIPPSRLTDSPHTSWDNHVQAYLEVESNWILPHDTGLEYVSREVLP